MSYNGIGLHTQFERGRISGSITVSYDSITFAYEGGTIKFLEHKAVHNRLLPTWGHRASRSLRYIAHLLHGRMTKDANQLFADRFVPRFDQVVRRFADVGQHARAEQQEGPQDQLANANPQKNPACGTHVGHGGKFFKVTIHKTTHDKRRKDAADEHSPIPVLPAISRLPMPA